MESPRQLGINANLVSVIQILCKAAFYALFGVAVRKHIILDVLFSLKCLVDTCRCFFSREDCAVIFTFDLVVGDMLNDHRSLLFVDKTDNLGDKFPRQIAPAEAGGRRADQD